MAKKRVNNKHKITVRYSSNNSGGGWWLDDADWDKLEAAGWTVEWKSADKKERFLGARATYAHKDFLTPQEAIQEWEEVLGKDASDEGCSCCGPPHNFSWESGTGDDKEYGYASGSECASYLYPGAAKATAGYRDALKEIENLQEQLRKAKASQRKNNRKPRQPNPKQKKRA